METAYARPADRVLYIEDSVINTKLMDRFFGRLLPDVELMTAPDGESGLRMLGDSDPDVVLLDSQLPGMSGLEFLQSARAAGNAVPVLVVTADASQDLATQMIAAGAQEVVTKPFDFAALLERITTHLPAQSNQGSSRSGRTNA